MKNRTYKVGFKTFLLLSFLFLYSCSMQYDTKLRDQSIEAWEQAEKQDTNQSHEEWVEETQELNF